VVILMLRDQNVRGEEVKKRGQNLSRTARGVCCHEIIALLGFLWCGCSASPGVILLGVYFTREEGL